MPQIDNPNSVAASIPGQIKAINDRLDELSSAQLGKVQFATGWASFISPTITTTPASLSTTVQVPALATSCGFSVFASGSGHNTTASASYLTVQVEVKYGSYDRYTYSSQNNIQAGGYGALTTPMVDTFTFPPGGGTLTLTASIWTGVGPWTDTSINAIFPEGLFVFQY
jgi:hypothetical protein